MKKEINDWKLEIEENFWGLIEEEYRNYNIAPIKENIFKVFELIEFSKVKVIILGQDPYPKEGDAHGIAFSVQRSTDLPASLKNIYKELEDDVGVKRKSGDLSTLVEQGVLFMNTVLTVRVGEPKSHSKLGWEKITTKIIEDLSKEGEKVFVLLGKDAQLYKDKVDLNKNKILMSSHPSPLAAYRGFLGSKVFSKINEELKNLKKEGVDWEK